METTEINKIGKQLEIYTNFDYIGKGFPIILPLGAKMIKIIRNYVEYIEEENGYKVVRTPSASKAKIYQIEDRFQLERRNKIFTVENKEDEKNEENWIVLKPYCQPFHCSIYNVKQHSYKELPIKYSETSTVFRNEKDSTGIIREREFTLSDCSLFVDKERFEKELKNIISMQKKAIDRLGLDVNYTIKTWDYDKKEDYIGTIEEWNFVTDAMKNALEELKIKYEKKSTARIYGPMIDIHCNGKDFSKIQVDFEIVHRFNNKFVNKNNEDEFAIYVHFTTVGSYEKLLSFLIEKFEGEFPLWIEPIQVEIITEGEEYEDYAQMVLNKLTENKIRAEICRLETNFQNKKKHTLDLKIPYTIIIGKDEMKNRSITVRHDDEIKEEKISELIEEVNECLKKYWTM